MTAKEINEILKDTEISVSLGKRKNYNRLTNTHNSLVIVAVDRDKDIWRVDDPKSSATLFSSVEGMTGTLKECVAQVSKTFDEHGPMVYRRSETGLNYGTVMFSDLSKRWSV